MNYVEIDSDELVEIDGGGGFGWVGLIQPIYDFGSGICQGFQDAAKNDNF